MREHIPHYVGLVHPLQQIVAHYAKRKRKEAIKPEWTPELRETFQRVKTAIQNVYLLHHRDDPASLRLYTDVSNYGIGANLCQVATRADESNQEQPLGFISKYLSDTGRRWSVDEKEAYAIFYSSSFNKWEHFLRGNEFYLFTDHKNFKLTFLNRPPSEKVMRWRLDVQEFDFEVAYIKGEINNVADAMSRCVPQPTVTDSSYKVEPTTSPHPTTLASLSVTTQTQTLPGVPDAWNQTLYRENRTHYFVPEEEIETFLGLLVGDRMELPQVSPKVRVYSKCERCPDKVPISTLP
jgi:hypothetical protein